MKQLIMTIVFLFSLTALNAKLDNSIKTTDYVVIGKNVRFFKTIRTNSNNSIICINNAGEKFKLNKDEVKAYGKKGKEYKRFYVVEKGSNHVKKVFLERICTRAGYTLYKKMKHSMEDNQIRNFFVYYQDKYELQLNEKNFKTVFSFFSPYCNLMFNS